MVKSIEYQLSSNAGNTFSFHLNCPDRLSKTPIIPIRGCDIRTCLIHSKACFGDCVCQSGTMAICAFYCRLSVSKTEDLLQSFTKLYTC